MRNAILVSLVVGCGGSSTTGDALGGDGQGDTIDAAIYDPLEGIGEVELVAGGFQFTEGPQWREAAGEFVFSDIPANTIYRHTPGGGAPTVFRDQSNNSNGIAIDGNGAVITAEHGSRSVRRDTVAIASMFEGDPLNSPNDVIVATDGTIYFTDPPYGAPGGVTGAVGFNGVYRLTTGGTLSAEREGGTGERPNGIGLSPDGQTLYVADTADGRLYTFAVQPDGSLGDRTMLAQTSGGADGLAIDEQGNIFVSANAGIDVFAPGGTKWGTIPVPKKAANCAFGGADHTLLYITAQDSVYRVTLAHPGLPKN